MRMRSLVLVATFFLPNFLQAPTAQSQTPSQTPAQPPKPATAPASPQSTHYPILLLGHGSNPTWSVMIGQKGPERLSRANYPPMTLEPGLVTHDTTAQSWDYHAKDPASGGEVTIHLTRESCAEGGISATPETPIQNPASAPTTPTKGAAASTAPAPAKDTFRISVEHSQIGALNGCARIAAELFPRMTNQSEDDDTEKKKPPVTTITNFKAPTATAFINPTGKIILSRGAAKNIAAPAGSELSLSHDGKKLLYTRNDSSMGSERTIVLYDLDTGRSQDLLHGTVRQAFWSPDDTRIACLQSLDQKWQVKSLSPNTSTESAAVFFSGSVDALHGWVDSHTVLASDAQNLFWISDGRPQQTVSLKQIYGDAFKISDTDTIRINPVNSDLLLISAKYATPPANAAPDASGIFLYEIRAKRRVTLATPDQTATHAEWSRDGIQVFYTRRANASSSAIYRIFWDGSGPRRYQDGSDLVVGQ
jgi:hypothetical protein